jgi:arylsulfatase A-like enzyme
LSLEEETLAESLLAAGYATAHIGKWHLGGAGFDPRSQGFDLNIAGDAAGSPLSYFAPFRRQGRVMPGLGEAPDGEYLTDRLTDEAERFIEANRTRPFFLYMPHFAVHIPMSAKGELIAKYPVWDGVAHGRQENPVYAAMLQSLDESVGRIVAKVEALGLVQNTLMVFTSDNGGLATREGPNTPPTINTPLREGKGFLYEGGLRVPLIMRWPSRVSRGVDDTQVWAADLPLTVKALCGLSGPNAGDGVSLASLVTEGKPLDSRPLFWHYPHYSNQGGRPGGAVRNGHWKLIEDYQTGRRELFDLERDPSENQNLAGSQPEVVASLTAKLAAWRQEVGAQMPTANPHYSPNAQLENGTVRLPAGTAEVHGAMLRFEPLPHKNTLGYWVRAEDWASWEFDVMKPGRFALRALVGCGNGSGGSTVEFRVEDQTLVLTVPVTGGFQKFVPQSLGSVTLPRAGRYRMEVRATHKPGLAVMDLREVTLSPESHVTHGFLATGGQTYIRDAAGKVTWRYPHASRDGWVLANGNILLALNKSPTYPGSGVVEVTRDGKVLVEYKGTQTEINTVQPLDNGNILTSEAGDRPRLVELNRKGEVVTEVPIKAQTADHHLQTRMSRKLPNGHYLVPELLDRVVREYTPEGAVVWEVKTPNMPFTAIRLDDGHTLIGCTLGNLVIEVDAAGRNVWSLTNDDLSGKPINDACGVQRLPNGNTVVTSHHAQGNDVKLTEVSRDKTVIWTYRDPETPGIHHFQILDTNGAPLKGMPLR